MLDRRVWWQRGAAAGHSTAGEARTRRARRDARAGRPTGSDPPPINDTAARETSIAFLNLLKKPRADIGRCHDAAVRS